MDSAAKEVKIVSFINDREGREEAERKLTELVNEGWMIMTSGGANAAELMWGFVILQKDHSQ
jgi:hypothetical protein